MGTCLLTRRGGNSVIKTPDDATNFKLTVTDDETGTVTLHWTIADNPFAKGVMLRYGTSNYPTSVEDGTCLMDHVFNPTIDTEKSMVATVNVTYYYKLWVFNYDPLSGKRRYSKGITLKYVAPETFVNQIIITSSRNVVIPVGWYKAQAFLVGGGGGSSYATSSNGMGGAGGGYTTTSEVFAVNPGTSYTAIIGSGGAVGGGDGGETSFGGTITAAGGKGCKGMTGGAGGSGGGAGGYEQVTASQGNFTFTSSSYQSGCGGSDGSDGGNSKYSNSKQERTGTGGKGQGTSTRAFGEANGTLYATGGSGTTRSWVITINYGGSTYSVTIRSANGSPGADNTGNGASAGVCGYNDDDDDGQYVYDGSASGAKGGSGIIILRRIA